MDIKELNSEGLLKKFQLTVSAAETGAAIDKNAQEAAKVTQIPGFRAGKVPSSVIKARYGDRLKFDTAQEFVESALKQIMEENKNFVVLGSPSLSLHDFNDTNGLVVDIDLEIAPEMPAIDLTTITIPQYVADYTDADLKQTATTLQELNSTLKPAAEGSSLEDGGVAAVNLEIQSADGKEILYKGTVRVKAGQPFMGLQGFDKQLIGSKAGETKTFELEAGDSCLIEACIGKRIKCQAEILGVYEHVMLTLDELYTQLGYGNAENFEKSAREFMPTHLASLSKKIAKQALIEKLKAALVSMELPKLALAKEIEMTKKALTSNQQGNEPDAAVDAQSTKLAADRLRFSLFLGHLARVEKIQINQGDVVAIYNEHNSKQPVKSLEEIPQNQREFWQGEAVADKAIDSALNKATMQENKVSYEELSNLYRKTFTNEPILV